MVAIYKGDNTGAFGATFITINATIPDRHNVTKAKFQVGNLPAILILPKKGETYVSFPQEINFTPSQTRQLQDQTSCYLAVWDEEGRKVTCKGVLKFVAKDEVVF